MKLQKPPIGILPKKFTNLGTEERITEIFEAIDRYLTAKVCPPVRWLKELDELFKKVKIMEMSYLELISLNIQVFGQIFKKSPDRVIFNNLEKYQMFMEEYSAEYPNRQAVQILGIGICSEPTSPCFTKPVEVEGFDKEFNFKVPLYFICGKKSDIVDGAFYGIELNERLPTFVWGRQINIGYSICKLLNKSIFRQCFLVENYRGIEESMMQDFGLHKLLMEEVRKVKSIGYCDRTTFKEWVDNL